MKFPNVHTTAALKQKNKPIGDRENYSKLHTLSNFKIMIVEDLSPQKMNEIFSLLLLQLIFFELVCRNKVHFQLSGATLK